MLFFRPWNLQINTVDHLATIIIIFKEMEKQLKSYLNPLCVKAHKIALLLFSSSCLTDLFHEHEAMQPFLLCLLKCPWCGHLCWAGQILPLNMVWALFLARETKGRIKEDQTAARFFLLHLTAFSTNRRLRGFHRGRSAPTIPNLILLF